MRLTLVLFRRNRLPNGNVFRGKDRMIKRVEPVHLRHLREDFAVEEQNMLYLRHPYLTEVLFYNLHNIYTTYELPLPSERYEKT